MVPDELASERGEMDEQVMLMEITVRNLFSLPPELADAAFRAAILRWFTPEVLQGVLGAGTVSGIESLGSTGRSSPEELYDQLRKLRFAEVYPGRGNSFHDMTRELVLAYLWKNDRNFYREVSTRAEQYFAGLLKEQWDRNERSEIDTEAIDWDLGVEVAYHSIVSNQEEGIKNIGNFLDLLIQERQLGTYHAVLQVLSEHAEAGRMSPDSQGRLKIWRLQEAIENSNTSGLEAMASEILQAPDASTPGWLKAEATYQIALGLRLASRYNEAEGYLNQNLEQCKVLNDPDNWLRALIELGMLEVCRENEENAVNYFTSALDFHVGQLRIPDSEKSESEEDTPLLVFDPTAWHRREVYFSESQDQKEELSDPNSQREKPEEEAPQAGILYFIECDTEKMGIDITGKTDDEMLQYEKPVDYDNIIADLWLKIGYIQSTRDLYDSAAACARLAGQMFLDLGNLGGMHDAVQFLRVQGANLGDLEISRALGNFEGDLVREATIRRDQRALLSGLISLACSQVKSGKYEEAEFNYQKANSLAESLNLANERASCLDGLARLDWDRGEHEQAVEHFRTAAKMFEQVKNREGWANSLLSLGELYLVRNLLERADECFHQALDQYNQIGTFTGQIDSLLRMSEIAKRKGDYPRSFAYLDQALELSRSRKDTRLYTQAIVLSKIAQLHLSLGHVDRAEEAFNKALTISEHIRNKALTSTILLDHAQLLSDMAEYESAVRKYDRVIELDLNSSEAFAGKAWALENMGSQKAPEAREAYEKADELQPDNLWTHKGIANALRISGAQQAAVTKYTWVVDQTEQRGVKSADRALLAWCFYELGEYEKAEEQCRQVVEANPDHLSSHFDLGLVLLCRNNYSEALEKYEQASRLLQERYPPLTRLGLIHVAIDDLKEAVDTNSSLSSVEEYNRILRLLDEQLRLARDNPEGTTRVDNPCSDKTNR